MDSAPVIKEGVGYRIERYGDTNEPLFIDTTEQGAPRDGMLPVKRNAIMAIVKDPATGRYLGLKWKKVDWKTLITGGIQAGQDAETAARAEIGEETGYMNIRLVKQLTNIHSSFFHVPKNENRLAHFSVLYFELENDEREDLSAEERDIHEVVWLDAAEMESFGLLPAHQYAWDELKQA